MSVPLPSEQESVATETPVARPAVRPGTRRTARLWAALILLPCLGLLGVAAYLSPADEGLGTHEQLGFGRCGMLVATGYPCPTCGMTTAFSHVVRGQVLAAFADQAGGAILALGTIATAIICIVVLVLGRPPGWLVLLAFRVTPMRLYVGLLLVLLGGWVIKVVVGRLTGQFPYQP